MENIEGRIITISDFMKDKFTFKVSYPDGNIEFWYNTVSQTISELTRLQKIHNNQIEVELIEE